MMRFLAALQMLTILPIRRETVPPGKAAAFFPIVGVLLGVVAGGIDYCLPGSPIVILFLVLATGGLHEDGLADCFDAFRVHRSPQKIHEILKDSRVGAFGAMALVFSILLRWQALAATGSYRFESLVASVTLARGSQVALAWIARPAGSGSGLPFQQQPDFDQRGDCDRLECCDCVGAGRGCRSRGHRNRRHRLSRTSLF